MQQQNLRHAIVVKAKTFPSTIVNRCVSRRGRVVKRQNATAKCLSLSGIQNTARRQSNVSAMASILLNCEKQKKERR
jgi:hypothetical protein